MGGYDVMPGGLTSANYTITFVKGTLTVTKATLTVTAENKTKLLNAANPTLTASYTGFVNGEALATSGVSWHAWSHDDGGDEQPGGHVSDNRRSGNTDARATTRSSS